MANLNTFLQTGAGRVWIQSSGPNTAFDFLTAYGAGAVNRPGGTVTPVYEPDPAVHNGFRIAGKVRQPPGLPTVTLETAYRSVASTLLSLKCPSHVQFRYGICDRPDIPSAWEKILHFFKGDPGTWNLNPNIARNPGNLAEMLETLELTGEEIFELVKLSISRVSVSETTNALSIAVSRNVNCGGLCGPAVEVCDEIFVGTSPASYGTTANLLRSSDGGATFAATAADPLVAGASIVAVVMLGDRVIAFDGNSTTPKESYSDDNGATWTSVASAAGGVGAFNDAFGLDWNHVWGVLDNGYILVSADGGGSLTTQNAGAATSQNLNKVRVLPSLIGYIGGAADTILKTTDGSTWTATSAVTGTGANIGALAVVDEQRVWVGAAGQLFYSLNGGTSWAERTFPGSGVGAINDIAFVNEEEGVMVVDNGSPVGSVLRTIDGGYTWDKSLTIGNGSMGATPTNAGLNAVAACGVNSAFAVGNSQGGTAVVLIAQ